MDGEGSCFPVPGLCYDEVVGNLSWHDAVRAIAEFQITGLCSMIGIGNARLAEGSWRVPARSSVLPQAIENSICRALFWEECPVEGRKQRQHARSPRNTTTSNIRLGPACPLEARYNLDLGTSMRRRHAQDARLMTKIRRFSAT